LQIGCSTHHSKYNLQLRIALGHRDTPPIVHPCSATANQRKMLARPGDILVIKMLIKILCYTCKREGHISIWKRKVATSIFVHHLLQSRSHWVRDRLYSPPQCRGAHPVHAALGFFPRPYTIQCAPARTSLTQSSCRVTVSSKTMAQSISGMNMPWMGPESHAQ
jgi:hypothetical protein